MWILVIGLVLLALVDSDASGSKPPKKSGKAPGSGQGNMSGNQRDYLKVLGDLASVSLQWPGIETFLDAKARGESRWNPAAVNPEGGLNVARGVYQLRSKSAFPSSTQDTQREFPVNYWRRTEAQDALMNPNVNTAAYLSYLMRLRGFGGAGDATWADLWAAGAFPRYINGPRKNDLADIANYNKRVKRAHDNLTVTMGSSAKATAFLKQKVNWPAAASNKNSRRVRTLAALMGAPPLPQD